MRNLLSALLCSALLVACSEQNKSAPSVTQERTDLQTARIELVTVERELRLDGTIEAINQATVAAQTGGRVTGVPFDVGDYVKQGDVIVLITSTEQKALARGADANLRAANAQLAEAQKQFTRVKDLVARKLMAQADFDRAKANLDSASAQATAAREALIQATEQAGYTEIRAPYSGLVVKRLVEIGETVTAGTPLMTGLSLQHLRVVVDVPQQHIAAVRARLQARVMLPDGRSLTTDAIRMPPSADVSSHTFRLLVTLPETATADDNHGIFPGTLVKVAFVVGDEQRLLLPPPALVRRAELTAVYVLADDGRLSQRYVRIGSPTADGRIPVLSGLMAGERIALDPLAAGVAYRQRAETPHDR